MNFRVVLYSYAAQIYIAVLGLCTLPLLHDKLGAEGYGLVGFFAVLQSLLSILDLGVTPATTKETTRFLTGALKLQIYANLLASLDRITVLICVLILSLAIYFSQGIAANWFVYQELEFSTVTHAVIGMTFCAVLRFLSGPVRGVIIGFESNEWLSAFNVIMSTLKFIVVLPIVDSFDKNHRVDVFFVFQSVIAVLEYTILLVKRSGLLNRNFRWEQGVKASFSLASLMTIKGFALSIAFTGAAWALVTQVDKFLFSKFLSLSDYATFSLAVLLAGGVSILSGALANVVMPRLAASYVSEGVTKLFTEYMRFSIASNIVTYSLVAVLITSPNIVLSLWINDDAVVLDGRDIFVGYCLSAALFSSYVFSYYLQFAIGRLYWHVFGTMIKLIFLLPVLVFFTKEYGPIGTSFIWPVWSFLYLTVWVGLTHAKILGAKRAFRWYIDSFALVFVSSFLCAYVVDIAAQFYFGLCTDCILSDSLSFFHKVPYVIFLTLKYTLALVVSLVAVRIFRKDKTYLVATSP